MRSPFHLELTGGIAIAGRLRTPHHYHIVAWGEDSDIPLFHSLHPTPVVTLVASARGCCLNDAVLVFSK